MRINVSQIDSASLNLAIQQASSGAAFSGNFLAYVQASGFMGPTVVWVTGAQSITGRKTFLDSPRVPYSGGVDSAPSAQWVNDQIVYTSGWANGTYLAATGLVPASGQLAFNLYATGSGLYTLMVNQSGQAVNDYATKSALMNTGAVLLARAAIVTVTGSSAITGANLSGLGGTQVVWLGNQIIISGGVGGGGGGSNLSVTGSSAITSPNLTGGGNVTVSYDGVYVMISGTASTAGTPNTVTTTGAYVLAGTYTFSGSPFVPIPTQPSGAANILFVSGASGVLSARDLAISGALQTLIGAGGGGSNTYNITGTGVVSVYSNASGNITNTFNITSGNTNVTSTGTTTNTFNQSGGVLNNNFNISGVTGNFVNMAFWFDSTTLATGLNNIEAMVGRSFTFTGYGIGVINTGTQGFFSGSLYQRTQLNTKTNFIDLSLNSGVQFKANGGFNQIVSGLNRVGLDIYLIGTGITGLSIGVFGVGF